MYLSYDKSQNRVLHIEHDGEHCIHKRFDAWS